MRLRRHPPPYKSQCRKLEGELRSAWGLGWADGRARAETIAPARRSPRQLRQGAEFPQPRRLVRRSRRPRLGGRALSRVRPAAETPSPARSSAEPSAAVRTEQYRRFGQMTSATRSSATAERSRPARRRSDDAETRTPRPTTRRRTYATDGSGSARSPLSSAYASVSASSGSSAFAALRVRTSLTTSRPKLRRAASSTTGAFSGRLGLIAALLR
jgi:hypothetical protein